MTGFRQAERALAAALAHLRENQSEPTVRINRFDLYEIDFLIKQLRKDLSMKEGDLLLAYAENHKDRMIAAEVHWRLREVIRLGLDPEHREAFEEKAREIVEDAQADL